MRQNNINIVLNIAKSLIQEKKREGNPDKLIHCIWYSFITDGLLFEDVEKCTLTTLMKQYEDNSLSIIIVIMIKIQKL